MTPKEKAIELLWNFHDVSAEDILSYGMEWGMTKQCALICAQEIINKDGFNNDFWQEVKHEIENL